MPFCWGELLSLDSVDSTNGFARRELCRFPVDRPTVVVAQEQTAGRGQFGRAWWSPKGGNLYLSLVEAKRAALMPVHYAQAAALAVKKVLASLGIAAKIKWPNDLLVGGKKICGILVETASADRPWVIVGVGLNVNRDPGGQAMVAPQPAVSISKLVGHCVDLALVQGALANGLFEEILLAEEDGAQVSRAYVTACSWMVGAELLLKKFTPPILARVKAFGEDGTLIAEDPATGEALSCTSPNDAAF